MFLSFTELSTIDLVLTPLPNVKTLFWCGYCGDVFSTNDLLSQHLSIHTAMEPFRCECCGRRFSEKAECESHILSYKIPAPLKCKMSPSGHFICRPALNERGGTYPFPRTSVCHLCGEIFNDRFSLRKHLLAHKKGLVVSKRHKGRASGHAVSESVSVCSSNSSIMGLNTRQRALEADNVSTSSSLDDSISFKCEECPGVKFYTRATFLSHQRAHAGKQKFICDCGVKTGKADDFRKHMTDQHNYNQSTRPSRINTDRSEQHPQNTNVPSKNNQTQEIIDKITNTTLKNKYSKWVKEGVKECSTCHKDFSSTFSMIRHQSVHTGIKPFGCTRKNCNYSTSGLSELKRHIMLKHGTTYLQKSAKAPAKKTKVSVRPSVIGRKPVLPVKHVGPKPKSKGNCFLLHHLLYDLSILSLIYNCSFVHVCYVSVIFNVVCFCLGVGLCIVNLCSGCDGCCAFCLDL